MNFFKRLFNGVAETPEEEQKEQEARDFDVLKYDGVAALRQHVFDYAEKCFIHALDIHDDLEIHDYLSQVCIQLGKLPEAISQLRILADAEPENLNIWLRMAGVAYIMEDYDTMAMACEKARAIDDANPRANYDYARALIGKNDAATAVEFLTKAIEKCGGEPYWEAYLLRGQTWLDLGKVAEAEHDADFLLCHIPDHEDALMLKACCQDAQNMTAEAIETLDKALSANPFCASALEQRARLKHLLGDEQGAGDDEKLLHELAPEDGNAAPDKAEDIADTTEKAYKNINPFA